MAAWRLTTDEERAALGDGGWSVMPLGGTLTPVDIPWKNYDFSGKSVPWDKITMLAQTKGHTARALGLATEEIENQIFLSLEDIATLCETDKGYWEMLSDNAPTCSNCGAHGYAKWDFCPICGQAKYVF